MARRYSNSSQGHAPISTGSSNPANQRTATQAPVVVVGSNCQRLADVLRHLNPGFHEGSLVPLSSGKPTVENTGFRLKSGGVPYTARLSDVGWDTASTEGLLETPKQVLEDVIQLFKQQLKPSVWLLVKCLSVSGPGTVTTGAQKSATLFYDKTVRRPKTANARDFVVSVFNQMPFGTHRAQFVRSATGSSALETDIEFRVNCRSYRIPLEYPHWAFKDGSGVSSRYFQKNIHGVPNLISHVCVYEGEDRRKTMRLLIGQGKLARFQVHRARTTA